MIVRILLAALIVYVPNQYHFPNPDLVKGLNALNLLFLVSVIMLAFSWSRLKADGPMPLRGAIAWYLVALTLGLLIGLTSPWADTLEDVTYYKNLILDPLIFILFYHASGGERGARQVLGLILFVAAVAALEAIREGLYFGFGNYDLSRRAAGPFGEWQNANKAGAYFALFIPVAASLAFARTPLLIRLVSAGAVLLLVMALFFTYSRTAYFAAAAGIMGLLFLRSKLLVFAFAVLIVNYALWAPESVRERVESTGVGSGAPIEMQEQDESTQTRFELWAGAREMIADHPAGVGLNHFKHRIGEYVSARGMDAHNYLVLTTAETGLFGGLMFIVLAIAVLRLGVRLRRVAESTLNRAIGDGFLFGAVAFLGVNMFSTQFTFHPVAGCFWMLAGTVARLYVVERERTVEASETNRETPLGELASA